MENKKLSGHDFHFRLQRVIEEYRIFYAQVSKSEYFFVGGACALMMWSIKFGPEIGRKFIWVLGLAWAFQLFAVVCGGFLILLSLEFSKRWLDFIIAFLNPEKKYEDSSGDVSNKFFYAYKVDEKSTMLRRLFFIFLGIGYLGIIVYTFLNLS